MASGLDAGRFARTVNSNVDADASQLLTAHEAAARLSVAVETIRRMGKRGDLPEVRLAGTRLVRYRLADVLRMQAGGGES